MKQMQYAPPGQQGRPQGGSSGGGGGCFKACLAALCCCCVAEEGCEACADCAGMFSARRNCSFKSLTITQIAPKDAAKFDIETIFPTIITRPASEQGGGQRASWLKVISAHDMELVG